MLSLLLCIAAFAFSYVAGRRSLAAGLVTVMTVGYAYGILRANVTEVYSHFIFDAAVVGLYLTQLGRRGAAGGAPRHEQRALALWVGLLIGWPFLLFFLPLQDYAVQFVGLRGNVFLLPFMLLGARLTDRDARTLALAFAALNLAAFAFALAEYFFGVERFYPYNAVTELIYRSTVDEDFTNPDRSTALRIPATFTSAHAFAGMLVLTFPFIFGLWTQKRETTWRKNLLSAALVASLLGVFMAAARSPVIILALLLVTTLVVGRLRVHGWVLWLVMLAGIGWVVSGESRLQRFTSLSDMENVSERVYWSVNESFMDMVVEYPMGNGLGGGGTSMPYFLQGRVVPPTIYMENEYARIILEQGVFGLCLWLAFIAWVFGRGVIRRADTWHLGRRLLWVACAAFFLTGMIGRGLLTSIPGTAVMLLGIGWIAVRQARAQRAEQRTERAATAAGAHALAPGYGTAVGSQ